MLNEKIPLDHGLVLGLLDIYTSSANLSRLYDGILFKVVAILMYKVYKSFVDKLPHSETSHILNHTIWCLTHLHQKKPSERDSIVKMLDEVLEFGKKKDIPKTEK